MRNFITIAILCFSFVGFAQTEKKVEKNDHKIDELNQRLDNLIGGSKAISGDSVTYKLDILFNEIQSLKSDMKAVRESLDEIKTSGVPVKNNSKLDNMASKIKDIESGEYYIILDSERDATRAENSKNKFEKTHTVKVVQNTKGTWYHVVLSKSQSMRSAIQTTNELRLKEIKDAWWVTGRKLKDI